MMRGRICLDAHDDQGIIRTTLDIPLTPETTLNWRWRLDEHPSLTAEDSALSHDYVSVALEFDDGSFTADIPRKRLSELFHVTQDVVSQVNPHVALLIEAGSGERWSLFRSSFRALASDVLQAARGALRPDGLELQAHETQAWSARAPCLASLEAQWRAARPILMTSEPIGFGRPRKPIHFLTIQNLKPTWRSVRESDRPHSHSLQT